MKRYKTLTLAVVALMTCASMALGQLASSTWPKFHRDYASAGVGLFGGTGSELSWTFQAGGKIQSSPVTAPDGTTYFTCADGKLHAVSGAGASVWSVSVNCVPTTAPAVGSDGVIYLGSQDSYLYAIRPDSTTKWKKLLGSTPTTSIAMGRDGSVYVGCKNGAFFAFKADGTQKWSYTAGGAIGSSSAVASDGTIYFGGADGAVYALNPTGALKWKLAPAGSGAFNASPTIGPDGNIYIGSANGYFYAIFSTGTQKWRVSSGGAVYSSAAVFTNGNIFYGARDSKLHAISSTGGASLWTISSGSYFEASPAVGSDGGVFGASLSGTLYALNPDGTERWHYVIGSPIYSSPALGPGGALLIGADDGVLYCFASDSTPSGAPSVADDGNYTASTTQIHGSWVAVDTDSGIFSYECCIGTAPGLADIAGWLNVGSATQATRTGLTLVDRQTYYVTVRAINGAGITGPNGSSDGITVDATAPMQPIVIDDGAFTADNTQLHAAWSSVDAESGIGRYEYSIGTTPGGTSIAAWTDAGANASVTRTGLSLMQGATYYISVRAYNKVGLVSQVGSSDGIMVDTAAPPAPTVTDDGTYTASLTSLHATWTTVTSTSGVASYEYSIGTGMGATNIKDWTSVGMDTGVTDTSLTLYNGTTYYINVRARNTVGKAGHIGSSDGITVDTTAPTVPVVTDEGTYTSSNHLLFGTWSASDPESEIAEYFYAVGTTPNGTDIRGWTSAGAQTSVVITSLPLVDGKKYYISAKARNSAGMGSSAGTSDGITVDVTPPSTPVVTDDGNYTMDANNLHAKWSASDAQSGIAKYEYSIGTAAGGTDVINWTDAGTATELTIQNLGLLPGLKYYINVRATNGAKAVSGVGSSDGIFVESTPPTTPVVIDDSDYTRDTGHLHATWTSEDPETGVSGFEYSIGTSAGDTSVVPWTSVGTDTSMDKTSLGLQQGVTYYINVRATNGIGMVSEVGSSDGLTVDNTPPSATTVTDDGTYTADNTQLHALLDATDAESGVAKYECAVGTTPGGTDIAPWQDAGPGPDVYVTGLQLIDGVIYYISARATNGAGITGEAGTSDGIKVDSTLPVNVTVADDGAYTGLVDRLHGTWSATDPESEIAHYRYCIGTAAGLNDVADWLDVGTATEDTRQELALVSGQTYYITVVAINGAGGESQPVSTDGIVLDLTPSTIPVVTDNGQYWGYKTYMPASWTSSDAESGVVSYRASIGTAPGATDVLDWVELGPAESGTLTGLSLKDGITYYVNVQALNGAGLWSDTGSSDGILLDSTPPTTPNVIDDGDGTLMLDRLHARWHSEDPESGIAEYMYCIGTSPGATDVKAWTSAGASEDITVTGLKLEPMLTYYFAVKARSGSGAWSAVAASDGIEFSTGAAIWWKFRNASTNNGRQQFTGTRVNDLAWSIPTHGYVESSPAIASDGTTYIGSGDGKIYAITQNGTLRWEFDAGSAIDSSPAVAVDSRIVVGCNSGNIYCLNPAGEAQWIYRAGGPVRSSALINGDRTYVGSNDGYLYAINMQTGLKDWSYKTGGAVWSSPACDSAGIVYVASGDAYIYAIKPDGTLKWRYHTGSAVDASPTVADDGTVYVGSGDGYFYAITPDGALKWRYDVGTFCDSSSAIGPDGNIYFGVGMDGGDGEFFALRPDGTKMWSINLPRGGIVSSPAIDSTGEIYVGSSDGKAYAINPNGTICWSYLTGSSVASSPAIGADSSVVFGSYDGNVYCLRDIKARDLTPPTTPVVNVAAVIQVGQPLMASWSATDLDTMVAEYTYAIGTAPGASDVSYWTSTGIGTSVSRDDLTLDVGKTYYVSVKARNPSQRWSGVGVSQGCTVVNGPVVNSIARIKQLTDQTTVSLYGKVVSAVFDDCFFVQETTRAAGIRCVCASAALTAGDVVNVTGTINTSNAAKVVAGAAFTKTGSGPAPRPLGVCARLRSAMLPDPFGLNVKLWGKVTSAGTGYCIIEGQAGPQPAGGVSGINIRSADIVAAAGDYIVADGVLCREKVGDQVQTVLSIPSTGSFRIGH